ncbi:hypothetical protein OHB14_36635 [Streptomyces sp. NBC_01613]|uniref:hypothetical protein n=1 Tax=Streptomyces sp. NBC_01613 TaxID=2975896 RepID=UPI003870B54E
MTKAPPGQLRCGAAARPAYGVAVADSNAFRHCSSNAFSASGLAVYSDITSPPIFSSVASSRPTHAGGSGFGDAPGSSIASWNLAVIAFLHAAGLAIELPPPSFARWATPPPIANAAAAATIVQAVNRPHLGGRGGVGGG